MRIGTLPEDDMEMLMRNNASRNVFLHSEFYSYRFALSFYIAMKFEGDQESGPKKKQYVDALCCPTNKTKSSA